MEIGRLLTLLRLYTLKIRPEGKVPFNKTKKYHLYISTPNQLIQYLQTNARFYYLTHFPDPQLHMEYHHAKRNRIKQLKRQQWLYN